MNAQREITCRPSISLKTIASFIILSFIETQVLIPTPTSFAQSINPKNPGGDSVSVSTAQVLNGKIAVPPELGKIEEFFQGETGKTILFIQDAHDSLEAQENIAKLIGKFVKERGIKTVFEEGYEGPVPTDKFFGFIKDPKAKQKVSYFLLDKLRVGGAEYAHINRADDFKLVGVEDLKLYGQNLQCYQESFRSQTSIAEDLDELFSRINILANQYFPGELKSCLKWKQLFSEGKLPLLSYLKELRALYLKGRPHRSVESFDKEYHALTILLAAEKIQDPKLIQQLNSMDSKVLFSEAAQLEKDISEAFLHNQRDQEIFSYYQGLDLIKRLNRIELTQSEYGAARAALQKLDTRKLANFIVPLTRRSLVLSKGWEQHIKDAVRFYDVAQKRDGTIDQHIRTFQQSKEEAAVLVFGGFHASAIKDMLRQRGFSYAVISPKITAIDKRHQDYYKHLMSEGHHAFEVSFLAARANKPPSIFFSAAVMGEETAAHSELQAIASSVEALGDNSDSHQIERHLADFNQEVQPPRTAIGTVKIRSEMRMDPERAREVTGKLREMLSEAEAESSQAQAASQTNRVRYVQITIDEIRAALAGLADPGHVREATMKIVNTYVPDLKVERFDLAFSEPFRMIREGNESKQLKPNPERALHMVRVERFFRALTTGDPDYFIRRLKPGTSEADQEKYRQDLGQVKAFYDTFTLDEKTEMWLEIKAHDFGYTSGTADVGHEASGANYAESYIRNVLHMSPETARTVSSLIRRHTRVGWLYLGEFRYTKFMEGLDEKGFMKLLLHNIADAASVLPDSMVYYPTRLATVVEWFDPEARRRSLGNYDQYRFEKLAKSSMNSDQDLTREEILRLNATVRTIFGAEEKELRGQWRNSIDILYCLLMVPTRLAKGDASYKRFAKWLRLLGQISLLAPGREAVFNSNLRMRDYPVEFWQAADVINLKIEAAIDQIPDICDLAAVKAQMPELSKDKRFVIYGIPFKWDGKEFWVDVASLYGVAQDRTDAKVRSEMREEEKSISNRLVSELSADGYPPEETSEIIKEHIYRLKIREGVNLDLNNLDWQDRLKLASRWTIDARRSRSFDFLLSNIHGEGTTARRVRIADAARRFKAFMEENVRDHGIRFFTYSGGSGVGKSSIWNVLTSMPGGEKFKKTLMYTCRKRRVDGEFKADIPLDPKDGGFSVAIQKILGGAIMDPRLATAENMEKFKRALYAVLEKENVALSDGGREKLEKILDLSKKGEKGRRIGLAPHVRKGATGQNEWIALSERIEILPGNKIRVYGEFEGVDYYFLEDEEDLPAMEEAGWLIKVPLGQKWQGLPVNDIEQIIKAGDGRGSVYAMDVSPFIADLLKKRFRDRIRTTFISGLDESEIGSKTPRSEMHAAANESVTGLIQQLTDAGRPPVVGGTTILADMKEPEVLDLVYRKTPFKDVDDFRAILRGALTGDADQTRIYELFFRPLTEKFSTHVTFLCGGTGSNGISQALVSKLSVPLELLLNAYDDGKSTGQIRRDFHMLGPSDIAKNIVVLLDPDQAGAPDIKKFLELRLDKTVSSEELWGQLMRVIRRQPGQSAFEDMFHGLPAPLKDKFREYLDSFSWSAKESAKRKKVPVYDLRDFGVRNLIFAGAYIRNGRSYKKAIEELQRLLSVRANILLNNSRPLQLVAITESGALLPSESAIVDHLLDQDIREIYLLEKPLTENEKREFETHVDIAARQDYLASKNSMPSLNNQSRESLAATDILMFAPTTLESSLTPTVATRGFGRAYLQSQALKVMVFNLTRERGKRTMSEHLLRLESLFQVQLGPQILIHDLFDYVIVNTHGYKTDVQGGKKHIPIDKQDIKDLGVEAIEVDIEDGQHSGKHNGEMAAQLVLALKKLDELGYRFEDGRLILKSKERKDIAKDRRVLERLLANPLLFEERRDRIINLALRILGFKELDSFVPSGKTRIIIAAAGRSTRLASPIPKALYPINGRPSLSYLAERSRILDPNFIVATNQDNDSPIRKMLINMNIFPKTVITASRGSGLVVLSSEDQLRNDPMIEDVLVIWGDATNIQLSTLKLALLIHEALSESAVTIPTSWEENPYAGVERDSYGRVTGLFQTKVNPSMKRNFGEHDASFFIIKKALALRGLHELQDEIQRSGVSREVDLLEAISRLVRQGEKAIAFAGVAPRESIGFNTVQEAEIVEKYQRDLNEGLVLGASYQKQLKEKEPELGRLIFQRGVPLTPEQEHQFHTRYLQAIEKTYNGVLFDVDENLTDEKGEVPGDVITKLVELARRHIPVGFVTGRREESLKQMLLSKISQVADNDLEVLSFFYIYHSEGAVGYQLNDPENKFYERRIPYYLSEAAMKLIRENLLSSDDLYHVTAHKITIWPHLKPDQPKLMLRINELMRSAKVPMRARLSSSITANAAMIISSTEEHSLVNKGVALEDFSKRTGLPIDQIVKVGDRGDKDAVDYELLMGEGSFSSNNFDAESPYQIPLSVVLGKRNLDAVRWLLKDLKLESRELADYQNAIKKYMSDQAARLANGFTQEMVDQGPLFGTSHDNMRWKDRYGTAVYLWHKGPKEQQMMKSVQSDFVVALRQTTTEANAEKILSKLVFLDPSSGHVTLTGFQAAEAPLPEKLREDQYQSLRHGVKIAFHAGQSLQFSVHKAAWMYDSMVVPVYPNAESLSVVQRTFQSIQDEASRRGLELVRPQFLGHLTFAYPMAPLLKEEVETINIALSQVSSQLKDFPREMEIASAEIYGFESISSMGPNFLKRHHNNELQFELKEPGPTISDISRDKQSNKERSELRVNTMPEAEVSLAMAARMAQSVRKNVMPAIAFVDAKDFLNFSLAQKQEYLFVALANKAIRMMVYNEHGQVQDKELAALLKLDHVERTDRDLGQAVMTFLKPNVPAIHLSKHVLPSQTLVGSLRKKVAFFKANGNKSGTLATALLWAISGGEAVHFGGVKEENGFWTVEDTLSDALQKTYDNNLVIAAAA